MTTKRVKEAIEEIKKGNMIIMIDDEDRENEGDLVYASNFSTPEKVNFMSSFGKGLICVAVSKKIAKQLELDPMVKNNNTQHETAFTVSVDDKNSTTGISSFERNATIQRIANPISVASDLVRPGHIFPLIAKKGGVLERTGHTEGSIDICALAGISLSAVICEIIKEDGEMARRKDLQEFAKVHNLKTLYISDLVAYRLAQESLVKETEVKKDLLCGHNVLKYTFEDHTKIAHTVYVFGETNKVSYVKFHNISSDLEFLQDDLKYKGLMSAIEFLNKNGGVLIFLDKNMSYEYETMKSFGIGAQILKKINIEKIKLLVNRKNNHDFVGLQGFGLDVIEEYKIDI